MPQLPGNTGERFPVTRPTLLESLRSSDHESRERGLDALVRVYWRPVYGYLRIRWNQQPEEAEDLTQEFFLRALEGNYFARYDPAIARFRTFLRTCLDGFLANEFRAAGRQKRGGGRTRLSLDFEGAEAELAAVSLEGEDELDRFFHQEWVRAVLTLSVSALEAHCRGEGKELAFEVFSRYDIESASAVRPTYQSLADSLGQPVTQITNLLAYARQRFRGIVLANLRELTATDAEFRAEAQSLLGVKIGR